MEKVKQIMYEQNGNINAIYLENLNRNQNEILELKISITEMKISLEKFKGIFKQTE